MSKLRLLLFALSLYRALVRADYTIDDSNHSVLEFSGNSAGPPVWGPFGPDTKDALQLQLPNGTMQTVDATQCYDGTYSYAACSSSNNCAVQFSFTGSGITVYVLQAGGKGISASLSIDSGTATTATLDAPPPPQYYTPHVTLFNVQNIPSGMHTAVMKISDWNGGSSGMMLDYIDVNQAQVSGPSDSLSSSMSPSPTSSSAPASTSLTPAPSDPQTTSQQAGSTGTQTNSVASSVAIAPFVSSGAATLPSSASSGNATSSAFSTSTSRATVAVVTGGVVGGVGGLFALLGLAFLYIRLRRHQRLQRPSPLLRPESGFTDIGAVGEDPFASSLALAVSRPSGTLRPLQSWTGTANVMPQDAGSPNLSHARVTSSGNESTTSSDVPLSIGVASSVAPISHLNDKAGPPLGGSSSQQGGSRSASLDAPNAPPNAVLTDEQADFANNLFRSNVPAPVVARVLERMLASPQGARYDEPELRSHSATLPQAQAPVGGMSWQPTMGDLGDGEMSVGMRTAPPSYDHAQAQ